MLSFHGPNTIVLVISSTKGYGNEAVNAQKMCPKTCGLCDDMRAADRQRK